MSSEVADAKVNDAAGAENNKHDGSETKGRKSQVKKLSALERTTQEGEALLKEMGYKEDGEDQGRRRTRSGARPAPVLTPPPAKKEKKTPKATTPSAGSGRRGRPPKKSINDSAAEADDAEMKEEDRTEAKPEAKEDSKPTESDKEEGKAEKETEKKSEDASEPAKKTENHSEKNDSEAKEGSTD